ncbi:hypothetical protein ACIQHU_01280 [Streptomyces tendae]|uniref:hypothetical protein n=1 Tax=Streptomyces tendae TaxID=1932 RepID=UPI0037F17709
MTTWDSPPESAWGLFEWRRRNLLTAIRTEGGEWTTGRVKQLYRRHVTGHIYRHNIRRDLAHLHAEGHLDRHDSRSRRYYTLSSEGAAV